MRHKIIQIFQQLKSRERERGSYGLSLNWMFSTTLAQYVSDNLPGFRFMLLELCRSTWVSPWVVVWVAARSVPTPTLASACCTHCYKTLESRWRTCRTSSSSKCQRPPTSHCSDSYSLMLSGWATLSEKEHSWPRDNSHKKSLRIILSKEWNSSKFSYWGLMLLATRLVLFLVLSKVSKIYSMSHSRYIVRLNVTFACFIKFFILWSNVNDSHL